MPKFRATHKWPQGFRTRVGAEKMVFTTDKLTEVAEHLADVYVRCYVGDQLEEVADKPSEAPAPTPKPRRRVTKVEPSAET